MKFLVLCFLAVSQLAFAKGTELECEVEMDQRAVNLTTIEIQNIVNCDFIREGTVCDWVEGKDQFSALSFDPKVLEAARVGDRIRGSYLTGYVWKTWEVSSDVPMTCLVK